ncbi:TetR/AcrR family transcriptional regulator [Pseudoclavibacter terrae]|uniref:TetR/AcrR family transcriptional regulator n=1 Tax=Pseudoclavibacter terrae TaxID=1530195 RepID=A0A7J5AXQ5_9MICO|nr:TetR/AcrR family transcriptional regulator [Pseudoclavibacter terrae]KAB1636257.1 TetR/AcrR family transcriptional regulator [Pseudoclavibacter terrae]
MSRQRASPKGTAKRDEILDAALRLIGEQGYAGATVRAIAAAVDLSSAGLLHHFGTKEDLYSAILERHDMFVEAYVTNDVGASASLEQALQAVLERNAQVPGLIELYVRFSIEGARPEHPAHAYLAARLEEARHSYEFELQNMVARGQLPLATDAAASAPVLLTFVEGVQIAWLRDPRVDMGAQLAVFFDLLGRPGQASG